MGILTRKQGTSFVIGSDLTLRPLGHQKGRSLKALRFGRARLGRPK